MFFITSFVPVFYFGADRGPKPLSDVRRRSGGAPTWALAAAFFGMALLQASCSEPQPASTPASQQAARPDDGLDPLQRPVTFAPGYRELPEFAKEISAQMGVPATIRDVGPNEGGFLPTARIEAKDGPAVDVLWRFVVREATRRGVVFLVRRDDLGRCTAIEFTTLESARERDEKSPLVRAEIPRLLPCLQGLEDEARGALRLLSWFGPEAEELLVPLAEIEHGGRKELRYDARLAREAIQRSLRMQKEHVPRRPPPEGDDPLAVVLEFHRTSALADDFARDLANASGVPVSWVLEDFCWGRGRFVEHSAPMVAEVPLREALWRYALRTGVRLTVRRDAAGKVVAVRLASPAGVARRGEAELADLPSARLLLKWAEGTNYVLRREAVLALQRMGAALAKERPPRPELAWVAETAAAHWKKLQECADCDLLQQVVAVYSESPGQFADRLEEILEAPVRLRRREFLLEAMFQGSRHRVDLGPTPLRALLWTYVLRVHDNFVWVARRDAAGRTGAIELATWTGVVDQGDEVLLDRQDVPTLRAALQWSLAHDERVCQRVLRLLVRLGAEAEELAPDLEELARDQPEDRRKAFADALVNLRKAVQRKKRPPPAPPLGVEPAGGWLAVQATLAEREWTIDALADELVRQTGAPIVVRYDDLAKGFHSLGSGKTFSAEHEPLEKLLRRYFDDQGSPVQAYFRRDAAGGLLTIEIAPWRAVQARERRAAQAKAAAESPSAPRP